MALVTNIVHADRNIRGIQEPVQCTYSIYEATDGRKYIQLVTYGTNERQVRGGASQTTQFDEAAARQLKAIIENTFPHLAEPEKSE
jgi:hypothetical protein